MRQLDSIYKMYKVIVGMYVDKDIELMKRGGELANFSEPLFDPGDT